VCNNQADFAAICFRERERESVCVCVCEGMGGGWMYDGWMQDGEHTHAHRHTDARHTHTHMHTWAQGGTAKSKVHMTWPDMIG
jgi:hypothetical protein